MSEYAPETDIAQSSTVLPHAEDPAWSRPHLQRTEIGPIFHLIAHNIYDAAERHIEQHGMAGWQVANLQDLKGFVGKLVHIASQTPLYRNALNGCFGSEVYDLLRNHQKTSDGSAIHGVIMHNESLVTIPLDSLVKEGTWSGLAMPLQLYYMRLLRRHLQTATLSDFFDQGHDEIAIDPLACAEEIESPGFNRDLHILAYTKNGVLGSDSTSSRIVDGGMINIFDYNKRQTAGKLEYLYRVYLDYDDESGEVQFSEAAKDFLRTQVRLNNQRYGSQGQTGGCPVRHSTFKQIGDHAQRFIAEHSPTGELEHQGTSAITRGAQLVAFALRHSATSQTEVSGEEVGVAGAELDSAAPLPL